MRLRVSLPAWRVPNVHCMVAREYRIGRLIRLWSDQLSRAAGPAVPDRFRFVCSWPTTHRLSLGVSSTLGWPMPARVLDLFTEFRCLTNGLAVPCGNGLLGALAYYGLGAIDAAEKSDMRDLAIRGGPFTPAERDALLDYCRVRRRFAVSATAGHAAGDRPAARPATWSLHGRSGVDGAHWHTDRRRDPRRAAGELGTYQGTSDAGD